MFVPKREEVAEGRRRLHNEEIHNLYASPNIIRVIKSREDAVTGAYGTNGGDEKRIQNFGRET
jgi:hypothetical protein